MEVEVEMWPMCVCLSGKVYRTCCLKSTISTTKIDIYKMKFTFDFLTRDSEKIADTLEIPQWCKENNDVRDGQNISSGQTAEKSFGSIDEVAEDSQETMDFISPGQRNNNNTDSMKDSSLKEDDNSGELSKPMSLITSSSVPDIFNPRESMGSERRSLEESVPDIFNPRESMGSERRSLEESEHLQNRYRLGLFFG